ARGGAAGAFERWFLSTPQGIATARAETAGTQVVTIIHVHKHNPYCVLLRVFVRLQPRRCPFQSAPGRDDCALCDGLTLPQFAQAYLRAANMVTAMEETGRAEARRTSDLPALPIYSVAVLLLILAWAHFPA